MMQLYTIKGSTNVERVALALAHKNLEAEHVEVPDGDRSVVRKVSGQDLVPVLVDGGKVVFDSMEIVRYLEESYPERPRLYPEDPARQAECLIFIDWFNRVWKRPPNALDAELGKAEPDAALVAELAAELAASRDVFEGLLAGRDHLFGEFSVADCAAFPFLRYARYSDPEDEERFHLILVEHLRPLDDHPRLAAWLERMERRPRG